MPLWWWPYATGSRGGRDSLRLRLAAFFAALAAGAPASSSSSVGKIFSHIGKVVALDARGAAAGVPRRPPRWCSSMNVHHGEGASLLDATAALCTCGRSVGRSQWNFFNSASSHHSWERRYSTALGYHLVATRHIPEGETVVAEEPPVAVENICLKRVQWWLRSRQWLM